LEFNRVYNFRAELVSETISKTVFHYVQNQIELYKDNFEHEKKNRPMCLLWGRRIHLGLRAYQELLSTLVAMENSGIPDVKESARVLKASVFFEPEYRELCLTLFNLYTPDKLTAGFLKDLVEANHVFLKILEHMARSKHMMIGKRIRRKKSKKKSKKQGPAEMLTSAEVSQRVNKESQWDFISPRISSLLQDDEPELPANVRPFDAASNVPVEDQKVFALYRIHIHLKKAHAAHALALMRAAREVWPEGEVFGPADAEAEDEFMTLREILFADMERPQGLTLEEQDEEVVDSSNENAEEIEHEEGEEGEEGEEPQVESYVSEQEFDFRSFVLRYAVRSVCSSYAQLFKQFKTNSKSLIGTSHLNSFLRYIYQPLYCQALPPPGLRLQNARPPLPDISLQDLPEGQRRVQDVKNKKPGRDENLRQVRPWPVLQYHREKRQGLHGVVLLEDSRRSRGGLARL